MQILSAIVITTDGHRHEAPLEISPHPHGATIALHWAGPTTIEVDRVRLATDVVVDHMLEHGWQSWSTVRPASRGDVRPERAEAPRWFRSQMLADPTAAGQRVAAETVLVHSAGLLGAAEPTSHPMSFACDATTGYVDVDILLDGLHVEPGVAVSLGGLIALDGPPGPAMSEWASLTGSVSEARVSAPVPLGWCSWYHYFTSITSDVVEANLRLARDHGLEVVQIDDGWQHSIGEWTRTSPSFGAPIETMVQSIRQAGVQPGIWTAPFLAAEGGDLALRNPQWLVGTETGGPRTALHHPLWGGRIFALDLTRSDVLAHIENTFGWLRSLGFSYFKVDFLHAGAVPGVRQGRGTMTRVEALRAGLSAIRRGIGDDAFLLGCGSPLGPSVGIVDAMRVSEDVAPHWSPRHHFPGWPECSVAAANSVEQTLRRAPLHRRWFANDPDCAVLRPSETDLTAIERSTVANTVLGTGGFVMVSDDLGLYGAPEWDALDEMQAARRIVDGPVELIDPLARTTLHVHGAHHRLDVDLTARSSLLSLSPPRGAQ